MSQEENPFASTDSAVGDDADPLDRAAPDLLATRWWLGLAALNAWSLAF